MGLVGGFTSLSGILALTGIGSEVVNKVFTEMVSNVKDLFDTTEQLSAQQSALNEVNKEAATIYAKERGELEKNKRLLEDENTSRQDKLKIIEDMKGKYPGLLDDLRLEGDHVNGLATGYARVVKAIELKARATAAANLLARQEEELLKLSFQFGIKSEEDAMKQIDRLRGLSNPLAQQIVGLADRVKAERDFLKSVQAESETGLSNIGLSSARKEQIKKETIEEFKLKKKTEGELITGSLAAEIVAPDTGLTPEDNARIGSMQIAASMAQELRTNEIYAEQAKSDAVIAIAEAEKQAKINAAQGVSSALSALSQLAGEQTAAGKILAIASATIDTYVGANKALAQGGIAGIASAVAVIATGLLNVKKIVSVKVPNDKGSGGVSTSAPIIPQLPGATTTRLDQQQLNQLGNATVRAFVVESDVANNSERIRRLNRAARIG
jgi:hypothetical protein